MKKMSRWILAMVCSISLFGAYGWAHDERGRGSKEEAYRYGYEQGYSEGTRHGVEDRRRRIGYDPNSREWREAGSNHHIKHKGDFKKGYREGYQAGYRNGYESRGPNRPVFGGYPGRYPERDGVRYPYPGDRGRDDYPDSRRGSYGRAFELGMDRGYRDGLDKGEEDYRKNRNADISRHGKYRDADDGYHSSYGDKRDYQAGYRQGFEKGYRESYRGDRYGRRLTSENREARNWPLITNL